MAPLTAAPSQTPSTPAWSQKQHLTCLPSSTLVILHRLHPEPSLPSANLEVGIEAFHRLPIGLPGGLTAPALCWHEPGSSWRICSPVVVAKGSEDCETGSHLRKGERGREEEGMKGRRKEGKSKEVRWGEEWVREQRRLYSGQKVKSVLGGKSN